MHEMAQPAIARDEHYVLTLEEISNLNPWLNDPTRIRAGRQILIPSVPMSPAAGQNPSPKGLSSSLQELAEK